MYTFADGSTEVSTYDKGEQTGPAKFVWTNGAVREGNKVKRDIIIYNLSDIPINQPIL